MAELALDLDHDAIALLRRSPGGGGRDGWERLDEARLDAPDLDARLRALRDAAEAAVSGGPGSGEMVEAELVIPDSQILYLDIDLDDEGIEGWDAMEPGERRAALAQALEGRTPYEPRELAFDWHGRAPWLRLAVVTAQTLREAEAFARAYGFAPARLRARPGDEAGFPAAPDFGRPPATAPAAPAPAPPAPAAPRASEGPSPGPEAAADPPTARASPRAGGAKLLAIAVARAAREARGGASRTRGRGAAGPGADRAERAEPASPGTRDRPAGPGRPRRRRGLAIAGGLAALVALASTAALTLWPDPQGGDRVAVAPTAPAEPVPAPSASPAPKPRPFDAEPVVVPVPSAGAPTRTAEADPDRARPSTAQDDRAARTDPPIAPQTDLDRARASYAATGIWQRPPEPIALPEPQEVAAPPNAPAREAGDPAAGAAPAALLVPPAETTADPPPAAMPPPPPPDAAFALGADGRVAATPEGAMTPDGIIVYAAAPPQQPPARPPETMSPQTTSPQTTSPETTSPEMPPPETTPPLDAASPGPARDPALADARPRPRPEDGERPAAEAPPGAVTDAVADALADALAEALTGGAAPEGRAGAAVTPALRLDPAAPGAPTDGAADGAAAASLFRAPEVLPEVTPAGTTIIDEGTASAFAVAASLRPYARPGDLAQSAEAARAAQAPPPQAQQAAQAAAATIRTAAAPAPVAAPQPPPVVAPAPATAAPAIPSRASVARRATVENALAMRRLALMGVFGAQGARRALVRLPSGRFEKLKVGDRLDGGQVTAIGDGRLIYVRRGRSLALDMPRE